MVKEHFLGGGQISFLCIGKILFKVAPVYDTILRYGSAITLVCCKKLVFLLRFIYQ